MTAESPIRHLLRALLRPVAALCARHALKVQEVVDVFKSEFVAHAERELRSRDAKVTLSRLSVLTGLQRREIDRIQRGLPAKRDPANLIFRIMNRWRGDRRFSTRAGEPKVLSLTPETGEFARLISAVSTDVGPAAVLFEMERLRFVERTPRGVRLLVENFIPRGEDRLDEGTDILAADIEGLGETVYKNLVTTPEAPHHHLRTEYDAIRAEGASHLRNWFLKEGHDLHLRARAEIARFDQEVNPKAGYDGPVVRVSFSSFNSIEVPSAPTPAPSSPGVQTPEPKRRGKKSRKDRQREGGG